MENKQPTHASSSSSSSSSIGFCDFAIEKRIKDNFHSKASSICSFSSAKMISSKNLKRIPNCHVPLASEPEPMNIDNQAFGSSRARKDATTRAMQGWHSQRANGNSEVSDPAMKVRQNSVIRFCFFIDFV